jgi:hypothetical protein
VINNQIDQKLLNHLWKSTHTTNAQITKILKFRLHNMWETLRRTCFGPKFITPNCTLCYSNDKNTWPHLLSLCENKVLKGFQIARHNAVVYQITNLLKSCIHTRHCTLKNACTKHNTPMTTPSHHGYCNATPPNAHAQPTDA